MPFEIPSSIQGTPVNQLTIPNNIQGTPVNQSPPQDTSIIGAAGKSVYHGVDTFATSAAKGMATFIHGLFGVGPTASDVQSSYETDTKKYNQDPDIKAHPIVSTLGQVAGNMIALAPTMAIPNPSGFLANAAVQAGQGAAIGGIMGATKEGAGDKLFDIPSAATGAATGAILSAPSSAIGKYLANTEAMGAVKESLKAAGNQTKVIGSDFTSPMFQSLTNNTLGNIPGLLGLKGDREAQFQTMVPDITKYLSSIGAGDSTQTLLKIQNILKNKAAGMQQIESDAWNKVVPIAEQAGIKSVNMTPINPIKQTILNNPETSPTIKNLINQQSDSMPLQDVINFKRNIWPEAQFLLKKVANGTANGDEKALSSNLVDMYGQSVENIKSALVGTPAEDAFHQANAITIGNKSLFNPVTNKYLVNAIDSNKGYLDDMTAFAKSMLSGASPQRQSANLGLLGPEGDKLLGGYGLGSILQKNINLSQVQRDAEGRIIKSTAPLNVAGFLQDLGQSQAKSDILTPTVNALSGLVQTMQKYSSATTTHGSQTAGKLIGAAGVGGLGMAALHNPALIAPALATPAALSFIARNAPVKNSLIFMNNVAKMATDKPNMVTYGLQKLNAILPKSGVLWNIDSQGNPVLDLQQNQ